jgi:hypothetical protein
MKQKSTSVEFIGNDAIISATCTERKWFGLGKERTFTNKFRGSGMRWRWYPEGTRIDPYGDMATCSELCDIEAAAKWERDDART